MCDVVGKRLARYIMKAIKPVQSRRDPVESLPEEVLHLIWRLLELRDLLSASLVSRRWHHYLSRDSVWKKFTDNSLETDKGTIRRIDKAYQWKKRFLSQRSLLHNWLKNRYHTCIKTPVTGEVGCTEKELCVWKGSSVALMSPLNAVVTNHLRLGERVKSVDCRQDSRVVLVTTADSGYLFRASDDTSEPFFRVDLKDNETLKLTDRYLCRCRPGKMELFHIGDTEVTTEIQLPDCKCLNTFDVLDSSVLIRFEPLDFNYESIFSLYDLDTGQWSVITKISTSPLGSRVHMVHVGGDHFLLANYLFVDDVYMYSNVYIYRKTKILTREIISNCRRKYFDADFAKKLCLFTVADYRISAVDLEGLKIREIYVSSGFKRLDTVLDRFFVLTYQDKLEVWDVKCLKRLYQIKVSHKDKVLIRDEFIAVTSWPGTSLPHSLRILNFTQPELTDSPSPSVLDLSNIFI